tara:strand:+ start:406 stop:618 length:213 start_codon:yes stop_codon:yes gene_type:complete
MTTTELIEILKKHEKGSGTQKPFDIEIFDNRKGSGRKGLILAREDYLEFSSSGDSIGDSRLFLEVKESEC